MVDVIDTPVYSAPNNELRDLDPLFLAWLAGFIDGDGCIQINRPGNPRDPSPEGRYFGLHVNIQNTDCKALTAIQATLGYGRLHDSGKAGKGGYKRRAGFALWFHGENAVKLLTAIRPYLRLKQEQASIALEFPSMRGWSPLSHPPGMRESVRETQNTLWLHMRELNAVGI